jgi:ferredoxin
MRTVVIYESVFGNTRQIAEAIAAGIRVSQPGSEVACVPVTTATAELVSGADLLIAGGPTHMRGMSSRTTRRKGAEGEQQKTPGLHLEPGYSETGLREWFAGLEQADPPRAAAAFDTRVASRPAAARAWLPHPGPGRLHHRRLCPRPAARRRDSPGRDLGSRPCQPGGEQAPGSSTVTTAPPPGWFRAVACPPWAWAMACTMAGPRPAPPSARARPESGRANRPTRAGWPRPRGWSATWLTHPPGSAVRACSAWTPWPARSSSWPAASTMGCRCCAAGSARWTGAGRAAIPTVPSGWCAAPCGSSRPNSTSTTGAGAAVQGRIPCSRYRPAVPVTTGAGRSPHPGRPLLRVDPIACAGRGLCAELLPELIALDDWGFPMVADRGVPPHLAADARATVKACPLLALRLERGHGAT